jgi:type VII secretion-associated serine protease mycosin
VLAAVLGIAPPPVAASVPAAPVRAAVAQADCYTLKTYPLPTAVWALTRLRPDLAWPMSRGAGATVAVIDSGVYGDHPTLAGKVLPGRDFVFEKNRLMPHADVAGQCDEYGHGTVVAGIIAGRETVSNGFRFMGVAPEATILPIRVLRDQADRNDNLSADVAAALNWAVDVGDVDVINLSLVTTPSRELQAAIEHALASGVVVVAAVGNTTNGSDPAGYPAAFPGVIGVAGSDREDKHVDTSATADYVDVAAPGVEIAGPAPAGDGYIFAAKGGTSFATAYVSGVAALLKARDPAMSPAEVLDRITRTADHPSQGWTPELGFGVVNPARAVGALDTAAVGDTVTGRLDLDPAAPAPRDGASMAAPWIAGFAALAALGVLFAVPIWRKGRGRSWHPGRS